MEFIQSGETYRVAVFAVSASHAGVTGVTINLSIRRDSDGFWWNGSAFQSANTTVTMTETDSSNLPGAYHYDFNSPPVSAEYTLLATTADTHPVNRPWFGRLKAGYWFNNLNAPSSTLASASAVGAILMRIGTAYLDKDLMALRQMLVQKLDDIRKDIYRVFRR